MTVHIQVNAPKAFRIGTTGNQTWGTQYLAYRISNYVYKNKSVEAANDAVSVMKNSSLFPKYVFPKGISNYDINFIPKLNKKLTFLNVVTQTKIGAAGVASKYESCYFYPKLELSLNTFCSGQIDSTYSKRYLNKTNGMKEQPLTENYRTQNPIGSNNGCEGEATW